MTKQYCLHHPTQLAHWHCPKCNGNFCQSCIATYKKTGFHQGETMHLCPKCRQTAEWIGAANLIEPFWTRLPKFFTYPLAPAPLSLIIGLAILGPIVSVFFFDSWILNAILWGILLKYAFAVLQYTARGRLTPPPINQHTISDDFLQVFKQYGIFLTIGLGVIMVFTKVGLISALIFLFVAVLSIPAMLIILVTTSSLMNAINPFLFIPLAMRIGGGYLLMYFFLILLAGAPAVLAQYIFQVLPPSLTLFITGVAENYYTLICYHLMGYVILQYHQEIGYEVHFEDFQLTGPADAGKPQPAGGGPAQVADDPLADEVSFLFKQGQYDEALTLIRREANTGDITSPTLADYYYKLLKMKKEREALLAHAKSYLGLLVQDTQKKRACEVFLECLSADPAFTVGAPILFKLGEWLNESGKSREALGTFNRLMKRFPDDPVTPRALFRAAQIYNDRLMNPGKAEQILKALIKKYPDHEAVPQVRNYLSSMRG